MPGIGGAVGAGLTYYLMQKSLIKNETDRLKVHEDKEIKLIISGLTIELEMILQKITIIHNKIQKFPDNSDLDHLEEIVNLFQNLKNFLTYGNFKAYNNYNNSKYFLEKKIYDSVFSVYYSIIDYGNILPLMDPQFSDDETKKASISHCIKALQSVEKNIFKELEEKIKTCLNLLN